MIGADFMVWKKTSYNLKGKINGLSTKQWPLVNKTQSLKAPPFHLYSVFSVSAVKKQYLSIKEVSKYIGNFQ